MKEQTFVYQEGEVKLTGRVAHRAVGQKMQELVEITPVNVDTDGDWKKWVMVNSLFTIREAKDSDTTFNNGKTR